MKTPFYKLIQADIRENLRIQILLYGMITRISFYKSLIYLMKMESIKLSTKAVLLNSDTKYY